MSPKILLTFDLEEFDLPQEYGIAIAKEKQLAIATEGLSNLRSILRQNDIKATFFTTAFYAENNHTALQQLVEEGHEIASHLYYHSDYNPEHIASSKQKLEAITATPLYGFRSPRLRPIEATLIKDAGYLYESSLNPTFIPGRYNNIARPRKFFFNPATGLYVLPFSVSPLIRFPLFWLSFKNLPLGLYNYLCNKALQKDGYLHLYFHPWEFADLDAIRIPIYTKRISGQKLVEKLATWITIFKQKGDFLTIHQFLRDCDTSASTSARRFQ